MPSPYDQMQPGLTGISKKMFALTPSDTVATPFRFLEAATAGTIVFVNLDESTVTRSVYAGQVINCAGLRVNSTGTTGGITLYGFE